MEWSLRETFFPGEHCQPRPSTLKSKAGRSRSLGKLSSATAVSLEQLNCCCLQLLQASNGMAEYPNRFFQEIIPSAHSFCDFQAVLGLYCKRESFLLVLPPLPHGNKTKRNRTGYSQREFQGSIIQSNAAEDKQHSPACCHRRPFWAGIYFLLNSSVGRPVAKGLLVITQPLLPLLELLYTRTEQILSCMKHLDSEVCILITFRDSGVIWKTLAMKQYAF